MSIVTSKSCMSESQTQSSASSLPKHCDVQPQYVYESTIHSQNLLNTLNEQRKFGLLCDITVIVEGVELLAHKAVLAACSSYFSGIITDPANVSHNIVLELSSISRIGMENLLDFAYTSKLTVSKDNIDHVLSAAKELEMKNLEYSCLNFLKQKLLQESSEVTTSGPCSEGKRVCKNSTISRKIIVPSSKAISKVEEPSKCCLKSEGVPASQLCTQSASTSTPGGCPMMAQLSINPKPLPSVQPQTKISQDQSQPCSGKSAQQALPMLKSLSGFCVFPKPNQPSIYPSIFHAPQFQKSEPVTNPQFAATCIQPQVNFSCSSKYVCNYNSDTDETFSADEDIKSPLSGSDLGCKSRKYPDVELPLSVEEITKLPRSELQELLNKQPQLSIQQISAVNEIRRRGKNRIAAQRCRKRKMDCIRALQCELEGLHKEYNDLMGERRCVRDSMADLVHKFKTRYEEVFSDVATPCGSGVKEVIADGDGNKSQPVCSGSQNQSINQSMAKFFENEVKQAGKLAEQLNKLPCNNLPPLSACPLMNPEIVICDDDEKMSSQELCNKPCSPGVCSNASMSSDVTDATADMNPVIDITGCTNLMPVQHPTVYKSDSPELMQTNVPQERFCKNSSQSNSVPASDCVFVITNTTTSP